MFEGVSHTRLDGATLLLLGGQNARKSVALGGAVLYLRGKSTHLITRTTTDFDTVWLAGGERITAEIFVRHNNYIDMPTLRPRSITEGASTTFGISAEMSLGSQHVYGFQGDRFFGCAQKAFLSVASADETRAAVEFHGGEAAGSMPPYVQVSIHLSTEVFQSTFKPLWLGSPRAVVDVTVGVCGFKPLPSSLGDEETDDFVMPSGAWSAELKSLSLLLPQTPI
ncbi:hypothetical protein [Rhodopseudomonas sp. B29]|uniref:hypothetical protein n=1 Tax=Rhodopseudomonas sp. B29 TaxID=95607 RepID=UPI0003B66609|nr:hypothetical protein [Rhodopseudomonas sp. B29]